MVGVYSQLRTAILDRRIVRIHRKELGEVPLDSFVLESSKDLVLLQPIRDRIDLDGYDVIRQKDISDLTISPKEVYYGLALRCKRQAPRHPGGIELGTMSALLASAEQRFPLLVIHREKVEMGACEIGRLAASSKRGYRLQWIDPQAQFEHDRRWFRYSDITLVQFGGAYENTLAQVAGMI